MEIPFISLVIPTCNRPDDLSKCLRALVTQCESRSIEILVCDDSKDSVTQSMVERDFSGVQWHQGPRCGPASNRNMGAKLARGQWLIFIDDDCLPRPTLVASYEREMKSLGANERVALEGPTLRVGELPSLLWEAPHTPEGGVLISCNFAIPRALFWEVGGFDERFPHAAFEDTEFALRVELLSVTTRFVPEAAVDHPLRPLPHPRKLANRWESRVVSSYDFGAKPWQIAWHLPRHVLLVIVSRFRGRKLNRSNLKAMAMFAAEYGFFLQNLLTWCRRHGRKQRSAFWRDPARAASLPRRFGL